MERVDGGATLRWSGVGRWSELTVERRWMERSWQMERVDGGATLDGAELADGAS